MPAFRNIRRSRRISRQPPRDPNSDECDIYDLTLMYPTEVSSPSPSTPAAPLDASPTPDNDAGEPEAQAESPPRPPSQPHRLTGQRSSHSRKRDPNYIPRPPNAFMLYRSDLWNSEKIKKTVERDHRQISRIAGQLWHKLSAAERALYEAKAVEAKRQHALAHPNYKFTPVCTKSRGAKRKAKPDQSEKIHRCQQVARLMQRGYVGDDLKRELEKRDAKGDEGYSSDDSEYIEDSRSKRAQRSASKKPAAPLRTRVSRSSKVTIQHEDSAKQCREAMVVDIHDASPKPASQTVSPVMAIARASPSDAGANSFVATDDIPDLSIGEPAFDRDYQVQFTDPFASHSPGLSMSSSLSSHDPMSPMAGFLYLSDDFLGTSGQEFHNELSSPDDAFIGIFDVKPIPHMPPYDGLKSDDSYSSLPSLMYSYTSPEYTPDQFFDAEPEFSEWMHLEN